MPDDENDGHEAIRLAIDVIRAGHLRPCTRRPGIHGSHDASGLGVAQVARDLRVHGLPDSRLRRKADTQSEHFSSYFWAPIHAQWGSDGQVGSWLVIRCRVTGMRGPQYSSR
jgi:hypothetical protein